jgi:hypothetical protein
MMFLSIRRNSIICILLLFGLSLLGFLRHAKYELDYHAYGRSQIDTRAAVSSRQAKASRSRMRRPAIYMIGLSIDPTLCLGDGSNTPPKRSRESPTRRASADDLLRYGLGNGSRKSATFLAPVMPLLPHL